MQKEQKKLHSPHHTNHSTTKYHKHSSSSSSSNILLYKMYKTCINQPLNLTYKNQDNKNKNINNSNKNYNNNVFYPQIRRLTDRVFDGLADTLETILLGDNLLGDNLNPVFSTAEFQNLDRLRVLDLSSNKLSQVEAGVLKGCTNLKVRQLYFTKKTSIRAHLDYMTQTCDVRHMTVRSSF